MCERTLVVASLLVLAACVAPTLTDYDRGRNEDLEAMRALPLAARVDALRDRLLRDGIVLRAPLWAGLDLDVNGTALDCHVGDFKCVYLVAPVEQQFAEDYLALGDALREKKDADGAILAYEDAIHAADTIVLSAAAAARIRAAALRGEETIWADRREPFRAKAAASVARAEEAWARTPDAEALEQKYQQLLNESRAAMQRDIDQAGQAAMNQLQQSLAAAQTIANAEGLQRNAGAAATLAAVAAVAQRVGPLLVEGMAGTKTTDLGFVNFVREVAGVALGTAGRTMEPAQLKAFLGSDAGKRAMVDVLASLQMLRRGDSVQRARHLMADALSTIEAPPSTTATPAASSSAAASPPTPAAQAPDVVARLKRLDELHEQKVITDDEYQKQRQRILEGL